MIKGTTCELYGIPANGRAQSGEPAADPALYKTAENVLVTPVSSGDRADSGPAIAASAVYELSFPKSLQMNELDGVLAEGCIRLPLFSGDTEYVPAGAPYEYIEANVPLFWNIKLKVQERNSRKYDRLIEIYSRSTGKDSQGFPTQTETLVLSVWAYVRTTRGMTLIANDSDFEKAYTNFTIRYPATPINREMIIRYSGKVYTIEYLHNIDERGVELEIQAKEVTH